MPKSAPAVPKQDATDPLDAILPAGLRDLIKPRPLIPGESPQQYDLLLADIVKAVNPSDFIEFIWIKDIADLVWETRRLRQFQASLIRINMRRAGGRLLAQVFEPGTPDYVPVHQSEEAVSAYQSGSQQAVVRVENALQALGLTEDALKAASFALSLPILESIERMLSKNEARRSAVLREIERRRFTLARRLRNASEELIFEINEESP